MITLSKFAAYQFGCPDCPDDSRKTWVTAASHDRHTAESIEKHRPFGPMVCPRHGIEKVLVEKRELSVGDELPLDRLEDAGS